MRAGTHARMLGSVSPGTTGQRAQPWGSGHSPGAGGAVASPRHEEKVLAPVLPEVNQVARDQIL